MVMTRYSAGLDAGAWGSEGAFQVGSEALDRIISESGGFRLPGRMSDPRYLDRLERAQDFYLNVLEGRVDSYFMREALSTSDFPLLMGDVLDRMLLGRYNERPPVWANYLKRGTVRDFRQARRIALDGLEGPYYPTYLKPELTAPVEDNVLVETGYTTQVEVYEKATAINWRMLINDDLDAFASIPDRLAEGARRTEQRFATSLYVDASGPHASMYTAAANNTVTTADGAVTNNPALSATALMDALNVLSRQVDAGGDPIIVQGVELVIPPSLEVTALNIFNSPQWEMNVAGGNVTGLANSGGQEVRLVVNNWIAGRFRMSIDPYIPVVASTANGNTSWFVFANPSTSRPAGEVTFLRGYEAPAILQKTPNTQRIGGGVEPMLGDFDTGEIRYKGRHIIGGTRLDLKASVASNGSGT